MNLEDQFLAKPCHLVVVRVFDYAIIVSKAYLQARVWYRITGGVFKSISRHAPTEERLESVHRFSQGDIAFKAALYCG